MFTPEQMHKVYILGLRKNKEEILRKLQELGTIHIKKAATTEKFETPNELIHDAVLVLEQIKEIRKVLNIKKGLFDEKKRQIKINETTDTSFTATSKKYISNMHKNAASILKNEKEVDEKKKDMEKKLEAISHFSDSDIRLESLGTNRHFRSALGKIEKKNLEKIKGLCNYRITDETENTAYIIFIAKNKDWKKQEHYITTIKTEHHKTIKEYVKYLEKSIDKTEQEKETAKKSAEQVIREKDKILAYEERWKNIKARLSKEKLLNRTGKTLIIEGWIPSKNIEKLKNIENIVIYTEKAKTEPPIKLNNPSFARPFEKITKWFGLPTYGNIDPTMFIAIGFPLFFAIMLTDAAYGFILLAISTIIYIKTDNKDIRSLAYILIVSSFATVISGLLFGSIFGEMFGFISVFDTLRDPMTILKISLLIGFLHINFGIALDIYSKIKTHSKGIIEPISWLSLEAGIVMLLLSTATATKYIGYGLIAFTIMIKAKDGFASILSIPSFIGSWISYIRLMALAVATSWLQFVINMGVSAAAKTSITFAMLVFIVGHAFNMALNIVSAFVHAMRLHYVEFFERFYKTGGEEFTPLKNENKYSA